MATALVVGPQLQVLGADGSTSSVFDDNTQLQIAGGQLHLQAISIKPDWFTAGSRGMATLVLMDEEPGPGAAGAAGTSGSQQWQWQHAPQKELGRFFLRLAPAAEQLLPLAAGPLFEGATISMQLTRAGQGSQTGVQQDVQVKLKKVKTACFTCCAVQDSYSRVHVVHVSKSMNSCGSLLQ